jgi:hypothetical protein
MKTFDNIYRNRSQSCHSKGKTYRDTQLGELVHSIVVELGRRCTIEPNCSAMSTRLAGASVTHEHALKTCGASCVPRTAKPFFVPVVHSPLGAVRYVAASELTSRGDRVRSHMTRGAGALGYVGTRARLVFYLDLKLICGGTRFAGY